MEMQTTVQRLVGWALLFHLVGSGSVLAASDQRLADAMKRQDRVAVRKLLEQHADVNGTLGDSSTALHWAAHWNDSETARQLIVAGANANAQTDLGVTPLYLAAEIGSAGMVRRLLTAGAKPDLVASTGVSPLMLAARAGAVDAVKALLMSGANANLAEKSSGQTALMWAVAHRHPDVVRALAQGGADVHARSRVSSKLVNKGAVNLETGREDNSAVEMMPTGGNTALMFAAWGGCVECAQVLLEFGGNVNDTGADRNNAVVVAAHSGQGALATLLLEKGADAKASGAGYTVLHAAILRSDLDLVKASLTHGADPNARIVNGTPVRRQGPDYFFPTTLIGATPIVLAAKYASVEMIRVLGASGADLQATTRDGTTALMAAAHGDHRRQAWFSDDRDRNKNNEAQSLAAVKTLLELGVDVNAADHVGNTAMHIAASERFNTVIEALVGRNARLDLRNKGGQTPLALVSEQSDRAAMSTANLLRKLGAAN